MRPFISNMFWVPTSSTNVKKIKEQLTVTCKASIYDAPRKIQLFRTATRAKDGLEYIGVPRAWGIANQTWLCPLLVEDSTVYNPMIDYPEFKFPEGQDYYPWQRPAVDKIVQCYRSLKFGALLESKCGCHAAGQGIMLYSGDIKKVEDIIVGDLLMGPDSKPREVLKLISDVDRMYAIKPIKGRTFEVNGDHILVLKSYGKINTHTIELTVNEYIQKSKSFKAKYKLFRVSTNFDHLNVSKEALTRIGFEPYFMGVLLGNGTLGASVGITTQSNIILQEINKQSDKYSVGIRKDDNYGERCPTYYFSNGRGGYNPVVDKVKNLDLWLHRADSKFIPEAYKKSSRSCRLELLAGLMDTDGHLSCGGYDYTTKSKQLSEDICYVARSVGLAAYVSPCIKSCQNDFVGQYYRISISGDCAIIPCKDLHKKCGPRRQQKDVLSVGFKVELRAKARYYGFQLSGDGRYLLDDYTVTHNSGKTIMATSIFSQMTTPTIVIVHKEDLMRQWRATFETYLPKVRIGHIQADTWDYEHRHVTIAMAQTLYSRRDSYPKDFLKSFGFVCFDEGHRYPAETFEYVLGLFPARYRLAVSATWRRSDNMEFIWHWHIGQIEHRCRVDSLVGDYKIIPWSTSLDDSMFRVGRNVNIPRFVNSIAENAPYNEWLSVQLVEAAKAKRKVLLASDRIEQILDIRSRIFSKDAPVSVGLYVGAIAGKKIPESDLIAASKCDIILATYKKMGEGTDIPALDTLFLGTPKSDIEQIVGRIQRPKTGKRSLLVVVPVFQTGTMIRMAKNTERSLKDLGFNERI